MAGVLVLSTLVPLGLGLWLDRRLGTAPLVLLICASIGIIAGTIGIVRIAGRTLEALGTPETEAGSHSPVSGQEDRA
jgi:F0F1-type ATP synthase assembly protein I